MGCAKGSVAESKSQKRRYADDLVVICKTKKNAEKAMELVRVIMKKLDVTV